MALTHDQARTLCQESELLLRPNLGLGNFAERAFAFLRALIPCELIAFGTLYCHSRQLEICADEETPDFRPAIERLGHLMAGHELFHWNPDTNEGRPFMRRDFYSARAFRQTDVYAEVMKPLGLDNHCAVHVPAGPGEISFFGIERRSGPDYSEDERDLLILGQSLLGSARRLAREREHMLCETPCPQALTTAGLTPREAEVLTLVADGKGNEEVAVILGIELYTVKDHIKRIFHKTGTPNRHCATLWALRTTHAVLSRGDEACSHAIKVRVRGELPGFA
ncbi:LuxR family transcriptional regulator [Ruficoccus amylovorans]|uniref:LuxR family transcriptional regulator n=1 Tax=Ruficoccus amylovorans TaxID=1804625 RepID=A0A842HCL8_9BACT|nr:LuxR family transcriptional regulator [Ruficoccus amylovorans]MBC2593939.1 LuxR family transcriptional regulator [Ruficoccus amylovorans]